MRIAVLLALVACQSSNVSRQVGARCDLSSECDQKCQGPSAEWPGGFCTIACDTDGSCPSGAACIAETGGMCAFTCRTDPDCAYLGQYVCVSVDDKAGGPQVMVCRGV